jgi:hypothetical protein
MPKAVVIDELLVTVRVPADLPEKEAEAVRETLSGDTFLDRLRAVILAAVREFPALGPVAATVSR